MPITHENFMQKLTNCVDECTIAVSKLKNIESDTPATHDELLLINGMIVTASKELPQIIQFVADEKPSPSIVGDKLKRAINLITEILQEKTRILNNTPQVFKDTNDLTSQN